MKKILYLIVLMSLIIGCCNNYHKQKDFIQNANVWGTYELNKKAKKEREKRIKNAGHFNYMYRYDFSHRWSDGTYLLCYFSSIERVDNSEKIKTIYGCNDSTRVILLKIKPLESYITPESHWPPLISDTLLTLEYLGISNFGCLNLLKEWREKDYTIPKQKYTYLLVQEHEIKDIQNNINSGQLNLLEYNYYSNFNDIYKLEDNTRDTVYSNNYFPYGSYDLNKLKSSEQMFRHYDSIDIVVRRKLKLNR